MLRDAAKTPWMWGVGVGVIALAAIAAGIGAYVASQRNNPQQQVLLNPPATNPAPVTPTNVTPTDTTSAPPPENVSAPAPTNVTSPTPLPVTPPPAKSTTASTTKPGNATASATRPKPTAPVTPPLEKPPVLAPASPTNAREAQAAQSLEVAKAKLAQNLFPQALADLRRIVEDFPGTRTAAEAAFMAGEVYEKSGLEDDAMGSYLEFEKRFGNDRRTADAKLRRANILGRRRQPIAQNQSLQLLAEVAREFPGTPQALIALQRKLQVETERRNLRAIDPVTKTDGPAFIATLRMVIEQFPDTPNAAIARNRMALAFEDIDRWRDAAAVREEMAAKNENPNENYFRLAELYERRLNDRAKALEWYGKVPPGAPRYAEAQRKLKQK